MSELLALRSVLSQQGIAAFIIGSGDAHQSEYVAAYAKRRAFISKFTGSAGTAVVTPSHALLWTDGRYFNQAEKELSNEWKLMKAGQKAVLTTSEWLCQNLSAGDVVGVDAFLMSANEARTLKAELEKKSISLQAVERNPVDIVWGGTQPPAPAGVINPHPLEFSGEHHSHKIDGLRQKLQSIGAGAMIVSMLDEVAWLLNIRGTDVPFNPVVISYAVVTATGPVQWFVSSPNRVTPALTAHFGDDVAVLPYDEIETYLVRLSHEHVASGRKILVDTNTINWRLYSCIESVATSALILDNSSIVNLAKSIKNGVELDGFRNCHIRDGAALTAYFCWLERTLVRAEEEQGGHPTEYSAAVKLEEFRGKMDHHVSPSFDTISSYGPNGAVIHYKPSKENCAKVGCTSLYLCDSGAQYLDGTTDVTRTMHFGTPTQRMKDCFTYVLKGHIALATAVFPEGMIGSRLDTIARAPLWSAGLDYNHGTGHGVGSYLCVHEGPQGIGFRRRVGGEEGFRCGMTVSNEPGYYEDGAFGIRIETICITVPVNTENCFNADRYCGFETITMCPIQQKLINTALLSDKEIEWVNRYHAEVRLKLMPVMQHFFPEAVDFLVKETEVLVKN